MASKLSNQQGYLLSERVGGNDFSFTTIHGIDYLVYFTEADGYVPSASFASEAKMMGFTTIQGTYEKGKRLPHDEQLWVAIFEVLYLYMTKHPNTVLLYVCSDESVWNPGPENRHPRFAKKRHEIFTERYKQWQQIGVMPVEKIDYGLYGQLYGSCVFRAGNPYEAEIIQVISDTVLDKQ